MGNECKWCRTGDFCVACESTNVEIEKIEKEKDGTVIKTVYCRDCGKTTGHVKAEWDIEKDAMEYEKSLQKRLLEE